MIKRMFRTMLLVPFAVAATSEARASVLAEQSGEFSRHWKSPTEIGAGAETILGTADNQNSRDFIALTDLAPGLQTLTFTFTVPDRAMPSDRFSAGGQVLWSLVPFEHEYDGEIAGSFQLSRWDVEETVDLSTETELAVPLYLGIYITHGRDVEWRLDVPGNAPSNAALANPPAIPVPAAAWYVLGGASLLTLIGMGRERKAPMNEH